MAKYNPADKHVDQALEREVLDRLQAEPALYWHLADQLDAVLFTGENAEAYRNIAQQLNEQAGGWDGAAPEALEACRGQLEQLRDLHQKRGVALLLQRGAEGLKSDPVADVLERLGAEVTALQTRVQEDGAGRLLQVADLFPALLEDVARRRQAVRERGVAAVGLPTGLKSLDRMLGGLQTGLHLLAAEPGAGKTSLALQLAGNVAREAPVLFVTFEETTQRLALKALCQRANLEAKRYADGYGDPADLQRAVRDHGAELARLYLVEGTSKLTIATVKALALQARARWKADRPPLVVVDYLQRWASVRRESAEYRLLVNLMVAELRELSQQLDCPVLAIASQNRAGQGEARMTSLKESAELEYSADSIWFLQEENGGGAGTVRNLVLTLAKNRYGDKGKLDLVFKPAVGTFAETAR